ncbi:MAG: HAD hydrolase family protein [Thaumarchaeota archaeon]|nr:HAD hydrolase family protein [Candidatus Geocrenenecus arthurdayi]MCL7389640.1 HAD hydrolase family protein [Candidatus Geocrenenecus arthurdayi]MCL7391087.1 HAD hydrolase family protein [Candidatus Geocrenenecus arthurdayi]MCL7396923.1 HAD hydrolase family protein [Candidatus Geocrenenecus arthurdayi]MCL7402202.1 HAD hydrolase family protein [Candidatus Geocrenenecus arthurdayi]
MKSNKALVLDLDGTLTKGGEDRLSRELRRMLLQFKKDGWILILATGRDRRYLESREDLRNIFDGWVCESGISIWIFSTGEYRVLVDERWRLFINEVKRLGCIIPKENTVNLSCSECIESIRLIASRLGVKYKVLNNKGSLLLLPENIDKFVGLNELLRLMRFKGFVAAIGDSEIDVEMLRNADFKAAPSNADQAVKEVVDYLSPREDGEGVIDMLKLLKHRFVGDC